MQTPEAWLVAALFYWLLYLASKCGKGSVESATVLQENVTFTQETPCKR